MRKSLFLIVLSILIISCNQEKSALHKLNFSDLSPDVSGVKFSNNIIENDTLNYFSFPFLYLGSGVSVGDINNDGLPDIYFTGNLVPNKLYLNKGNMKFEDISKSAGVSGDNRWYSGTTMADVNNDGYLDIYVSVSGKFGATNNQLFINNGDNTFTERANEYGIDDSGVSIQSTFFDYDNDGDLDLFVANYPIVKVTGGNQYYKRLMDLNRIEDSGHLYKNNGNGSFTDVTVEAGVHNFGLTLGLVASDFNNDGFKDLYLSNDFNVPDYFYQNNGDGTFSEISKETARHTSMFGMGIDASDFNNDGFTDILQVDMTAEDYKRSKTNMASMSPATFYEAIDLGFNYQYMQNSLQLNQGINEKGLPIFSEISRFAGLATTDWSWGALFADFDNDGFKDAFITNGVKRDVNNNDVNAEYKLASVFGGNKKRDYTLMPSTPIANYAFSNNGDYTFSNKTKDWGLDKKGFSNGFAYSDLDNDGDLDIVINNMDDFASVYVNNSSKSNNNYIKIKLLGKEENKWGIGAKVSVNTSNSQQTQELTLTRGYQSSVDPILHFGLGTVEKIEEIKISWPNGNVQVLNDVELNQLVEVKYKSNSIEENKITSKNKEFKDITNEVGLNVQHIEDEYDDFKYEPLLPHIYSKIGPGLTVGDVNNDGLDDFFVGNAAGTSGQLYMQNENSEFNVINGPWQQDAQFEDTGALFFDADNDSDLDLYVVSGGNSVTESDNFYQDRLYLNTGTGFIKSANVLPNILSSGQQIIKGDYDGDGDLDLFVGGRIVPGKYPFPAQSFILQNNGKKDDQLRFTNVTSQIAPELNEPGLVTSALWDDFDADGKLDLIVTGEWMPIRFFKNTGNKFEEVTNFLGLKNSVGWWYGLQKIDVDLDGDLDYLAGNLGLNYKYHTSSSNLFEVYANDFDENGNSDIVLSYQKKGVKLPLRGRECSSQQVSAIKQRFKTYEAFANAELEDIYGERMLNESLNYKSNTFAHFWIENDENGKMKMHQLPNEAQFSSINQFQVFDYNGDKYPDVLVGGNLYGSEVETPRNDAGLGLVLTGSSKGFTSVPSKENKLFIEGEIKAIKPIKLASKNSKCFLIAINNNELKLIEYK